MFRCVDAASCRFDLAAVNRLTLVLVLMGMTWACAGLESTHARKNLVDLAIAGEFETLDARLGALQKAFLSDPEAEKHIERALMRFASSDPKLKESVDRWVEAKPGSAMARTARGIIYHHLGWLSRGTAPLQQTRPESIVAMLGFFRAAKRDLTDALLIDRKISTAYTTLMGIETAGGRREEIMRVYRKGVREVPGSSSLHLAMAHRLDRSWGGSDEAMDGFFERARKSSAQNPGYRAVVDAHPYFLAKRAYRDRQFGQALAFATRALQIRDEPWIREQRARILLRLDKEEEALTEIRRLIERYPDRSETRVWYADYLIHRRRHEDALEHLDAALERDPFHPEWLAFRASILAHLKRFDEAERDFNDALVFGSFRPSVVARRGRFFEVHRRDQKTASLAYRRARDLAPDWIPYWKKYADTLFALKDCEYIPVAARFAEMCVKSGKCGEEKVQALSSTEEQFRQEYGCQADASVAGLLSLFRTSSEVRKIALSDLKLNASVEDVRRKFPGIKIEAEDHPGGPGVVHVRKGTYESDDRSLAVRAIFSRDRRLLSLTTTKLFAVDESLAQIRDRLLFEYGRPDRMFLDDKLEAEFKQKDSSGRQIATLHISVDLVRLPEVACRLPAHLRNGRTVARMHATLRDNARSAENTRKTLAQIRVWDPDAIKKQNEAQQREIRERQALIDSFAKGC